METQQNKCKWPLTTEDGRVAWLAGCKKNQGIRCWYFKPENVCPWCKKQVEPQEKTK